jgi:hypothetical protein
MRVDAADVRDTKIKILSHMQYVGALSDSGY